MSIDELLERAERYKRDNLGASAPEGSAVIDDMAATIRALREALSNADLKFRDVRYHANNGHQDRPVHIRLRLISDKASSGIDAISAAFEASHGRVG